MEPQISSFLPHRVAGFSIVVQLLRHSALTYGSQAAYILVENLFATFRVHVDYGRLEKWVIVRVL